MKWILIIHREIARASLWSLAFSLSLVSLSVIQSTNFPLFSYPLLSILSALSSDLLELAILMIIFFCLSFARWNGSAHWRLETESDRDAISARVLSIIPAIIHFPRFSFQRFSYVHSLSNDLFVSQACFLCADVRENCASLPIRNEVCALSAGWSKIHTGG